VHELALMDDLVATIADEIGDARVVAVRLEVGRDAGAVPRALEFCFDVCTRGTLLEGASLEIHEVEGDALRLKEVEVT
jgi:hydrogenase nickel incorporation protein HypA/HybF